MKDPAKDLYLWMFVKREHPCTEHPCREYLKRRVYTYQFCAEAKQFCFGIKGLHPPSVLILLLKIIISYQFIDLEIDNPIS